jgi:hypothetical protein
MPVSDIERSIPIPAQRADRRMVQLVRYVASQKRLGRISHPGVLGRFRTRDLGWKTQQTILRHSVANFPRIALSIEVFAVARVIFDHASGAFEYIPGKVTVRRRIAGNEFVLLDISNEQRLEIVRICAIERCVVPPGKRQLILVIVSVKKCGDADLLKIAPAKRRLRLSLGAGESGQEHSGQNRNDRNHHQQLNQGERGSAGFRHDAILRYLRFAHQSLLKQEIDHSARFHTHNRSHFPFGGRINLGDAPRTNVEPSNGSPCQCGV